MIVDKNKNELQVGDMVRFIAYRHGPYELGIIEVVDESGSGSLYIKCIGPLQHVTVVPQRVEKVLDLND